ncbi:MAG: 23S rRNA (uracil(1939)-C(5))-methyltransferase RlmD [Steroidobacteraceae bacterium]
MSRPAALRAQTVLEECARVAGLTHEGEGIVREGKTVFIPGALPGETVRFVRTRRHRQHDEGRLLEILAPAAARVTPRCAHFGVCGGCALQHLSSEAQLALKQTELADNLERLARVACPHWLEPLAGPAWGYRRRARLGAKYVAKKGKVVVGFRERNAPYVADLQHCDVLSPPVGEWIAPLGELIGSLEIRARLPQIEVAVADNATALVLRVLAAPSAADRQRLRAFATRYGVRLYLQPGGLESIEPLEPGGALEPLYYTLADFELKLEFRPSDFVQINDVVNRELVRRAVQLCAPGPGDAVLDLYCGLGNFTLPLARSGARVVGVEGESQLIERARGNAARNGIANVEFHVADLSRPPDARTPWLRGPFSHVLLDPPRVGAREMLATIAALRPRRVLYISCHPGSLARDLGVLVHEHGFTLEAAGVIDMFPHTGHVESMALLTGR